MSLLHIALALFFSAATAQSPLASSATCIKRSALIYTSDATTYTLTQSTTTVSSCPAVLSTTAYVTTTLVQTVNAGPWSSRALCPNISAVTPSDGGPQTGGIGPCSSVARTVTITVPTQPTCPSHVSFPPVTITQILSPPTVTVTTMANTASTPSSTTSTTSASATNLIPDGGLQGGNVTSFASSNAYAVSERVVQISGTSYL